MEANSRQLTLFDREGNQVTVVGAKDLYQQPSSLRMPNGWP
jgi:hypothetical protein